MPDHTEPGFQAEPRLHIAMRFQGRWVRKVFVRGAGVPRRWVYSVLRGIKTGLMPRQVRMRKRWAESMVSLDPDLERWQRTGHRAMRAAEFGDLEPILTECRAMHRKAERDPGVNRSQAKDFLRYVSIDQEFLDHPEIVRFVLSEPVLRAVSAYLGTVPVLASVALLWSPPQREPAKPTSSQRFHNDHEDVSQIKFFIHVNDVEDDHGVFTFHPAEPTSRIRAALGTRRGRLDDAEVARVVAGEAPLTLIGPAGSAHFVDTSRCLHFGSRPSPKGRLILQAQYLRCNSPAYSNLALTLSKQLAAEPWSPLQRMALGLREVGPAPPVAE